MNISPKLKTLNLIALLIIVFITAIVVWYAPALFKGYAAADLWKSSLLARNLSQNNVFGVEDEQNIFLAPSLVKERAQISTDGNKLTPVVLAQIFKITGLPKYEKLIFISIAILAFVLLIFALAVYYLFDLKTAAIFSFIYILLPFNWWYVPYNFGVYEITLLFFSLFFLFYFLGTKYRLRYRYIFIALSGIFLALAGMARETIWVIVPVLFIYLLIKKEKKYLISLFVPFLIIISLFWLPNMISGQNSYLIRLIGQSQEDQPGFLSWDYLSHLFPDPYTYHFDQENYLDNFKSDITYSDLELITRLKMAKAVTDTGLGKSNFIERFKIGSANLIRHTSRFLAIEDIGGPFIFLLLIFGFIFLKREYNYLYRFFVFWIIFVIFFVSYISIGARNHLMDFGWVVALVVALGLLFLIDILSWRFRKEGRSKIIIGILLTLLVLYSLVLSGHVLWGRVYDEPHYLKILAYAEEINKLDIADKDVIAIGLGQFKINKLNYLTSKSMVVFAPETLEKLIKEDRLQVAFNEFNVKYVLGYSEELTKKILENSQVANIASDSLAVEPPATSKTKSWLMNLIR